MSEAIDLLKLISSTPDFQRKLNDYVRAKQDAEEAIAKADIKKAEAAAAQAELDAKLKSIMAEISDARKQHDAAAAEAAARIKLAIGIEDRIRKAVEILKSIL